MIWYKFHNSKLVKLDDGTQAVRLKDLFDLPREDNIKRLRAKIQNEEHKFFANNYGSPEETQDKRKNLARLYES